MSSLLAGPAQKLGSLNSCKLVTTTATNYIGRKQNGLEVATKLNIVFFECEYIKCVALSTA